jgi:class 3 adenylate cyclase
MDVPEPRFVKSGDLYIAYQVVGDGPVDVIFNPAWYSHLEVNWQYRWGARLLRRIASFSRLIVFDQRGTGLSDPISSEHPPTLEERAQDVRAVMDDAGSARAVVMGAGYGGTLGLYFAASHPDRASGLVLFNPSARRLEDDGYPGMSREEVAERLQTMADWWGTRRPGTPTTDPIPEHNDFWAYYRRMCVSPGVAVRLWQLNEEMDVRDVLPAIRVPTLLVRRKDARLLNPMLRFADGHVDYLAHHIEGSRVIEAENGRDRLWLIEDDPPVLDAVEEFITGVRPTPLANRVLATVLFTDIVASTERAATLGDERWKSILERRDSIVQAELDRHRGKLVSTAGDGIVATFDGPARAVQCASAIRQAMKERTELDVRSGLHTGEVEMSGNDISGIAVHISARIEALARPAEVLVSSTVKDLVIGSGLEFEDRGGHELKGVPGRWQLYAVV